MVGNSVGKRSLQEARRLEALRRHRDLKMGIINSRHNERVGEARYGLELTKQAVDLPAASDNAGDEDAQSVRNAIVELDHGKLRAWRGDESLRRRMLVAWRKRRPDGEQTEREAEERGASYREWQRELRAAAKAKVEAANALAEPETSPLWASAIPEKVA